MLKKIKPTSAGQRHRIVDVQIHTTNEPHKSLISIHKQNAGRNAHGHVTTRHRSSGGVKRYYRLIDFKRSKRDVEGKVLTIEYDPNRSASICLISYRDGEKRYIIAPEGLKVNDVIVASESAEPKLGNALPLKKIPIGMPIHNLELIPGKGAQIVRSAGGLALIQSKEAGMCTIKLPSGEVRLLKDGCFATIGQASNPDHKNAQIGKAGRKRHMGWRPTVRGVAQHPDSHPHGGGEGRSGIGMPSPKTPWGKPAMGFRTRKRNKYSSPRIVSRTKGKVK
ncbi:MAG: 50S ribosomal protein L2 [bacterium]